MANELWYCEGLDEWLVDAPSTVVVDRVVEGEVVDELPACDHPIAETIRQEFRVKDAHTANKHVYTVRAIQHAIDDVAEQAHRTLKQLFAVLNWVERKHKYDLRDQCIEILEQAKGRKRKYVDFEAGRVSLGQTGGPKMHDKDMLLLHLENLLPNEVVDNLASAVSVANEWLEGSGGRVEWTIQLDHPTLKTLVKNGATLPGYGKTETDAYGKVTIGEWSADNAKKLISAAFGKRGLSVWQPEQSEGGEE